MSDLPEGWETATLAELAGDGLFADGDWVESKDQDPSGDVRLTQLADVGDSHWRNRSNRFMTSARAKSLDCTFLQPGDVLIARMPEPLGRACIFPGDPKPSVTVVDVCIVRPGAGGVDPQWLMHFLNSPEVRAAIAAHQAGTTRKRISRKNLGATQLPVPPYNEQQRIVARLEESLSILDAASVALDAMRRKALALKKSILLSTVPNPLPANWRMVTVGEAGTLGLGLQRSPQRHSGPSMRPYLRVANVFEDRIDSDDLMEMNFSDEEFERFRLIEGDVLLNEGQSPELLGRPAIYRGSPSEVAFTNSLIRFRANDDVLPDWALLVFRRHMHSGRFRIESRITTNIAHLSLNRLKTVEFPIPSIETQRRIVDDIVAQLSILQMVEQGIRLAALKVATLRQAVLSAAYNGRLVPQDTTDEPASSLLQRIKSQAEAVHRPSSLNLKVSK